MILESVILDCVNDVHWKHTGNYMTSLHQVYFSKIAMKLSRLAANPEHIDSWHDIAGYATLIEQDIRNAKG